MTRLPVSRIPVTCGRAGMAYIARPSEANPHDVPVSTPIPRRLAGAATPAGEVVRRAGLAGGLRTVADSGRARSNAHLDRGGADGQWNTKGNWGAATFANGDDVIFSGAVNTATLLGANARTVNSIRFLHTATASFSISLRSTTATRTLTFPAGNAGITIGAGDTVAHQIDGLSGGSSSYINLLGDLTVTHNGKQPFTISRPIAGAFGLIKSGPGTLIYSGPTNYASGVYSGNTTLAAGTLKLGAVDVIPNGPGFGDLSVAGTLDLNAFSETVNGLSGSGIVDNQAAGTATLTVGDNDQSSTFSGVLKNTTGTLALTKMGAGSLTLSGINTYNGPTTLSAGELVGVTGGSAENSGVTLSPGSATLGVSVTDNTKAWTTASLTTIGGGLKFIFGSVAPGTQVAPLRITGRAAFTVPPTVTIEGNYLTEGTYPLMTWASVSGAVPVVVNLPPGVSGTLMFPTIRSIWCWRRRPDRSPRRRTTSSPRMVLRITPPVRWPDRGTVVTVGRAAGWRARRVRSPPPPHPA